MSSNNPFGGNIWQWPNMQPPDMGWQNSLKNLQQQNQLLWFLGQQFSQLLGNMDNVGDWQTALNHQFAKMKTAFEQPNNPFAASAFLPDTFQQGYFQTATISSWLEKLLSLPGIGYHQKRYKKLQHGAQLLSQYQTIYQEFSREINKINITALSNMQNRILNMGREGKNFNSLREIYDLWVECGGTAYADYVHSKQYSELYGRLSNALSALQQHTNSCTSEILSALNIPSHQEMKTVLQRLQTIKRSYADVMNRIQKLEQQLSTVDQAGVTDKHHLDTPITKEKVRPTKPSSRKKTSKKTLRKVSKKTAKKTVRSH